MNEEQKTALAKLREPFKDNQISKLPKETKKQIEERKSGQNCIRCKICGGWHHKNAVHLDYVGHAALTDRLLDVDPEWDWQPTGFDENGAPSFDQFGGMWIKLTICGMTRLGYGHPDGKRGGDAVKEVIGDALRNAAMRFGAALDLWHKGELHIDDDQGGAEYQNTNQPQQLASKANSRDTYERLTKAVRAHRTLSDFNRWFENHHVEHAIKSLPQDWFRQFEAECAAKEDELKTNETPDNNPFTHAAE